MWLVRDADVWWSDCAGMGGSRSAAGQPAASPEDPADQRVKQLLAGIGKVQPHLAAC